MKVRLYTRLAVYGNSRLERDGSARGIPIAKTLTALARGSVADTARLDFTEWKRLLTKCLEQ